MNTPIVDLLFCAIQATVVVLAAIAARACLSHRHAASRVTVITVGTLCMLAVTGLAFVPLPSIWRTPSVPLPQQQLEAYSEFSPPGNDLNQIEPASASGPPSEDHLLLDLLHVMSSSLREATHVADSAPRSWQNLLVAVVLAGVALAMTRVVIAIWNVRCLRHNSVAISDKIISDIITGFADRCGCRRSIEVLQSAQIPTAATFGWLRPVILLPADWREWSLEELTAVVAHEVVHIRRGDFLVRIILQFAAAVHFYHPLVKALSRQLAADQEFATDRLARGLQSDPRTYLRGLAKLALRYDQYLSGGRGRSSVSIIPRSSDFLARRLEMLRTKDGLTACGMSKAVSWFATTCVVAVAIAVLLLRGPAVSAEEQDRPQEKVVSPNTPPPNDQGTALFNRKAFDPSIIPHADHGAFLIRVAELLKHPEMQPRVEKINQSLTESLREWTNYKDAFIDLSQIEWIAGSMELIFKGPKNDEDMARMMLSSGSTMIRMTHAADWQAIVLKRAPGAKLKEHEGVSYVELPVIPVLGPAAPCLRFPDERTILLYGGFTRESVKPAENLRRVFSNHRPDEHKYGWTAAWRSADQGLITLVCDFTKSGWADLPANKKEAPPAMIPLTEKAQFYAFGADWLENGKSAGMRMRVTCTQKESVRDMHLAASVLLNRWPEMFLENSEAFVKFHRSLLQLFSSINLQPSPADGDQHYVQLEAAVPFEEGELVTLLRAMFE